MRATLLALAGLFSFASAATWQSFASDDCSWGGGAVIVNQIGQQPSSPIPVGGQHSFRVDGCLMQVVLYESTCDHVFGGQINDVYVGWGMISLDLNQQALTLSAGACYHVNTGHEWNCAVVNCV